MIKPESLDQWDIRISSLSARYGFQARMMPRISKNIDKLKLTVASEWMQLFDLDPIRASLRDYFQVSFSGFNF